MPSSPDTNVYVDGFNLYYGAVKGTPYKWLDIPALCRDLLPRNEIREVHYFTARVKDALDDPRRSVRQQTFIRALSTLPGFYVHEGRFLAKPRKYPLAPARSFDDPSDATVVYAAPEGPTHALITQTEEKGSDVNLASRLLADAFRGRFEVAVVLSNDSDLVEPIRIVTEELGLPVGIVNPRKRFSVELAQVATFKRTIDTRLLRRNQLPETLDDEHGTISKPEVW